MITLLPAFLLAACAAAPPHQQSAACPPTGSWVSPATGRIIADPVPGAAAQKIVLLGEHHDSVEDHRWQLRIIQTLYAANPSLVLGFEMFPRAAQPALDAWVRGGLSEPAFLDAARWREVWGMDSALYMPIFRFARDHRVPMLALNISRDLVHRVSRSGWAGVAVADREGVGTPGRPSESYRKSLAEVMAGHGGPAMTPDAMSHFVDAQLLWDRAMAEAIASQHRREPRRQIVSIMGAGHLEHRDGVPRQLAALGLAESEVFLRTDEPCPGFDKDLADAVYLGGAGQSASRASSDHTGSPLG